MTIRELKKHLERFPEDTEIMILDGFNGGGYPREINCGPWDHEILEFDISQSVDCEGMLGANVCILGYGCY